MIKVFKKISLEHLIIIGLPLFFIVFSILRVSDGKNVSDSLCFGFGIIYVCLAGILANGR